MNFNEGYRVTQAQKTNIFSYISPCCLDYNSLELDESVEGCFTIKARYNSTAEVYVSVFINVTEYENLIYNLTEKFVIAEKGAFEKHLLCKDGKSKEFRVLVKFPLSALSKIVSKPNKDFPECRRFRFVIRLEPKSHPHRFVNTYYYDLESMEGKLRPKLIKHKIELKNQAYYVYEIYGLESMSNNTINQNNFEQYCKFCLDKLIEIIILPCRHMCLCLDCAKLYNERDSKNKKKMKAECPVCKNPIASFLNIQGKNILSNVPLNDEKAK